jgi:Ca2+-binding RTX toxin-like protein
VLDGGTGNDLLNGGTGNDSLYGREGADVMIGGGGNDHYFVDDANDKVQEAANGGIDLVWTTVNYTLDAHVENAAADAANLTINGNDLNNIIYGTSAAGQTDTLSGNKGDDVLNSGRGNDVLNGGEGNDVIDADLGADKIDGGAGNDLFRYTLSDADDLDKLGGDLITGFEVGKDKIDLYDLFVDFEVTEEDVIGSGVLRLEVSNGDTLLQFDKDGGADSFVTLATLEDVTGVTLADLIFPQNNSIV